MPFIWQKHVSPDPSQGGGRCFFSDHNGSAVFYILMAIGLLAALTFSFTKGSRENITTQLGHRAAEDIYIQSSVIRSAIVECTAQYPSGGGDMDNDGVIDADDNPNSPYPLNPSSALILRAPAGCTTTAAAPGCVSAAGDDQVRNMVCVGAPIGEVNIFQGAQNKGRFLPPPPIGFEEWTYINDVNGVAIRIIATSASAAAIDALARVMNRFATCQADLDYGSCGAACLTIWVTRAACP